MFSDLREIGSLYSALLTSYNMECLSLVFTHKRKVFFSRRSSSIYYGRFFVAGLSGKPGTSTSVESSSSATPAIPKSFTIPREKEIGRKKVI
jgi:hypothetical protein